MRAFRERRWARAPAYGGVLVALAALSGIDCGSREPRSADGGGGRVAHGALDRARDSRDASAAARDSSNAITRCRTDLDRLDRQLAFLAARTERLPTSWTLHEEIALGRLERARLSGSYADYAAADSAIARAFEIAPAGTGPFLARAALSFTLHRLDRVEPDLAAAEKRLLLDDGSRAEIEGLRADVALHRGRYDEALQGYRRAATLQLSLANRFRLAMHAWQTGDFAAADSQLVEAAAAQRGVSPQPRAWIELQRGLIDLARGRATDALAHYRVADSLYSGWWLIEEHIAEVAAIDGRRDEARAAYESLIHETGDPEFMDALAGVLEQDGDADAAHRWRAEARGVYESRLERFPEATYGHALRHYLEHEADAALALSLAERNHALRPGGEASMLLAQARAKSGRLAEARSAVESVLATPWTCAELHATAAVIYAASGDPARAAEECRKAEAIDPGALSDLAWLRPGGDEPRMDGALLVGKTGADVTSSTAGTSGDQIGFDSPHDAAPAEPSGVIVAPGGRRIQRGTRDDLGYVLPLDVRREKAPRPPRVPPPREAIDRARRDAAKGSAFSETRLGPDDGHTQNETSIAVAGDTLVAGWNNYTDTTLLMGVARSTDRGLSWTSSIIGGHAAMSDPAVKSNGAGAWYYGYIASGGPGGADLEVFVQRSTDAGVTWLAPVAVTSDANFDDKPYIDAAGSDVLVGYADFGFSPAKVRAARSTNGGTSFGSDIILANNSVGGNGACPVIDATGNYFVFWRDSFQDSLWVAKSTDRGSTWTPDRGIVAMNPLPSMLPGGFRIVNLPSADADPLTGTLVVVWNDQLFGNPDILSIRSTDGGATWSAPVRVNDDAGTAAQWFPWLTIDESGVVHVVWYDRRGNGSDIDVYYARSLDGGATYEPNLRVTAAAFTAVLPWEGSVPDFIGDYNGIAAAAGLAYPFYQDSREGNQDVYVATIDASIVSVPPSSHEPPSPALTVVATPNPFRASVALRVATPDERATAAAGHASIEIVTAEGRLVRRIPAHDRTALWDGRDATGRALPSGIYFAHVVDSTQRSEATRLIKLD